MGTAFADWQPRFAERGIATFPVKGKRPAVSNYLKLGLRGSQQLAAKFPSADAFGLACRRNAVTVLDIDDPSEKLLADALDEFGPSPFVVRTGSGNHQAWYRSSGERRRIRPDKARPIDILGDGYVVAPPSAGAKGDYQLLCGTLDDLANLPPMRSLFAASKAEVLASVELVDTGKRNETLWRECMAKAHGCNSSSELLSFAFDLNASRFREPLSSEEVMATAAKVWAKEEAGENWFGRGGRVVMTINDIDDLLSEAPDAFMLLTILKRHHWGPDSFMVANAMAATMPDGGWRRERFTTARRVLIERGYLEEVRRPSSYYGPAEYRFKGAQK